MGSNAQSIAQDTIFAHSSGSPPAAIAVIRISGPRAFDAVTAVAGGLPPARRASLRSLRDDDGETVDQALVLRFDGPASVTGEDLVELHCHGGRAVVAAVLRLLAARPGLREALPGEFTRRAFANGRIDLTEAEGLADLLEAETELQRKAALSVAGGALRRQIEEWRRRVVDLSARAEAAIDYVGDEEVTGADGSALQVEVAALGAELKCWLEQPRAERLRQGIRVVVAGPPNAGKSSLVNRLVGEDRAIVTDVAGTTRDLIEVPVAIGGVPFTLVDTAGLRATADTVERIGVERAEEEASGADILLWMGAVESAPNAAHLIPVRSKSDLKLDAPAGEALSVSSVTGEGVEALKSHLVETARELLPLDRVALNDRQAMHIADASTALNHEALSDLVLIAEALRSARTAMDRVTGRAGLEDVLDGLFARFCLGK